jgi:hypothetical protein
MRQEGARHFFLVFRKAAGTRPTGKQQREVEVQPGIDAVLAGKIRGALGIAHKHHGANRRERSMNKAIKSAIGCKLIAAPIIGIHDNGRLRRDAAGA